MKKSLGLLSLLFILCYWISCTPKTPAVTEKPETPATPTPPPPPEDKLSPCPKFSDLPYAEADALETDYVVYRRMLTSGEVPEAFERWKKVYAKAPAADGLRNTVYTDGIYFYEYFLSQTQDSTVIKEYVDEIFNIYDEIERCYPSPTNDSDARKAFDMFYKYPYKGTHREVYALMKKVIDKDGEEMPYYIMNPFGALLVEQHNEKNIDDAEAKKYTEILNTALETQLAECKGEACKTYEPITQYLGERLDYFETVKGFYDCAYFTEKYYADYQANPGDCDNVVTVLSRLKFGGCTKENSTEYNEILNKYAADCREPVGGSGCYSLLQDGNYNEAIDCFNDKAANEADTEKKAKYTLLIAKIYYAHLKNFSQARRYAQDAADIRGNWGDPYLLIGRMYASSGPLCGSGRGWNSQVVVWPALDMWYKAKNIDPAAAGEANKFINQYSRYMPTKEDIFIRNLKVGDSYTVPCWIQRSTQIRSAD